MLAMKERRGEERKRSLILLLRLYMTLYILVKHVVDIQTLLLQQIKKRKRKKFAILNLVYESMGHSDRSIWSEECLVHDKIPPIVGKALNAIKSEWASTHAPPSPASRPFHARSHASCPKPSLPALVPNYVPRRSQTNSRALQPRRKKTLVSRSSLFVLLRFCPSLLFAPLHLPISSSLPSPLFQNTHSHLNNILRELPSSSLLRSRYSGV